MCFFTVHCVYLICVALLGFVVCVVWCLCCLYMLVNDLWCLFCDSVCNLSCSAVCAVCPCVFCVVMSVICGSSLFPESCVLSVLCVLCMCYMRYGFFTACWGTSLRVAFSLCGMQRVRCVVVSCVLCALRGSLCVTYFVISDELSIGV